MESRGEYGRNHDFKGSLQRYKMNLYQGSNSFTSSFHDKFYIGSMGMNTKVQGRLPLIQCLTFHSLLVFEEIVESKNLFDETRVDITRIVFDSHRLERAYV